MSPSTFKRALGAVKDQTSIGLAKVGNSSSRSDLNVAIVKATRHEEFPAEEKYIREILNLTRYSRAHITSCVSRLSRRLNKTRNWTVALKTLVLIQRLLAEGDPAYEEEIFFATRRGTRFLNMSDFRDSSGSNSWDYSAFVRTYALYLDERLEHRMQGRRGKRSTFRIEKDQREADEDRDMATPMQEMKNEQLFSKMQHLQQLLQRFLACRPTGGAKNDRVVFVALYPIAKESFQMYYEMMDIMAILIDRFTELEVPDCVRIYETFSRIGKQLEELDAFYSWCKNVGIARSSEFPEVEKITRKKLDLMDEFIRDKIALAQDNRAMSSESKNESIQELNNPAEANEVDMNSIKALPPPETQEEKLEEERKENLQLAVVEADLLNLGEDAAATTQEHGDNLAIALFDGVGPTSTLSSPTWAAFNDNTPDWEVTLVQSASRLSSQPTVSMAGGFDMMLLNGMYEQGIAANATTDRTYGGSGSASSVAFDSAGRPSMLTLPAPPGTAPHRLPVGTDPFAPSLGVAPPPYVQMSDMEKKQRLLVQEQRMWQQYNQYGMQGPLGFSNLQANPYNMGGYMRSN